MNDKKAGILKIIVIVFLVLLILILAVGVYLYYFHVFKTLRFCVTNNVENSNITCSSNEFCTEFIINNVSDFRENIESAPAFAREKINEILNAAVFCDETCRVKEIRGFGDNLGAIDSCDINEKEILFEIHGKEGLALIKYMKKQGF